jgi:hypothetical protein
MVTKNTRRPEAPHTDGQWSRSSFPQASTSGGSWPLRHTAVNGSRPPDKSSPPVSGLSVDFQEAQRALETVRTADDVMMAQAVERAVSAINRLKEHSLHYHAVSDKNTLEAQGTLIHPPLALCSTTVSRSHIRLIQYLDSVHGLVRR